MLSDNSRLHEGAGSVPYDYRSEQGKSSMNSDAMQRVIPAGYLTTLSKDERGYRVLGPPFGSDYTIELMAERPAAKYIPVLQESS